jgi:hypothetical protein
MILLASILLTACGGSESTKEALLEPGPDEVNPTISNLVAVNQCNYTKSVGLDNTIIFDVTGSESLMKPVVTVLGEKAEVVGNWTGEVDVKGSAKTWKAEFPVLGPETIDAELKQYIASFSYSKDAKIQEKIEKISHSVSFQELAEGDTAGLASSITAEYGIVITDDQQQDSGFNYDRLFEMVLENELFFESFEAGSKTVNAELREFIVSFSDSLSVDDISDTSSFAEFGDCYLADALEIKYPFLEISDDKVQDAKFDYSQVYFTVLRGKLEKRKFNNYPSIAELQDEVKAYISTFSDATPAVEEIFVFTAFSELGGADQNEPLTEENDVEIAALASSLAAKYGIEITLEDQQNPDFAYGTLFDRILEAQLPSVKKFKEIVAQFNDPILDSNGDEIEVPLQFLNLGLPSVDGEPNEVIKEIMSVFAIKTTDEEREEIAQAVVPPYAWVDKIQSLEIPITITYADNSGMQGEDITLTSTDALRYCEDGVCQCFPEDISGKWQLRPKAGSMGVGRAEGDIGDWFATDFVWGTERACLWDDEYIFKAVNANNPQSGSFVQIMGDSTWLEPWQSPNGVEECGTPQSPFDGSTDDMTYQWNIEDGTLTLFGYGAHIGLPRVANDEENTGAVPFDRPVVYTIQTASDDLISLNIKTASASPWWHFELQKMSDVELDSGSVDSEVPESSGGSCGIITNSVDIKTIDIDPELDTITLTLSDTLFASTVPSAEDFQVIQAGTSLGVDNVTAEDSNLILAVSGIESGAVQVSYTQTNQYLPLPSFTQMIVSDGYIRDAEVYADANNDGIADEIELIDVTTDAQGQLFLSGDDSDKQIIIKGGVNVDTGAVNTIELTAPAGYSVINPLSTLVQKIVASDDSQTLEQAEEILTQALGISLAAGEDLSSYDPISDVSENALNNRVATTQIATVLAVAAAADEEDDSGNSNIEAAVISNIVELVTSSTDPITMDQETVIGILSDDQGNDFAVDINAATTAVVAMEAIKQDSDSVDLTEALGNMIKAQASAIDDINPASPDLDVNDGVLEISFDTDLVNGSAIVVGDTLEIFEADSSFSTYVLQKADIENGFYALQLPNYNDIEIQYTATILDIAGNIGNQSVPVVYDTVAPIITSGASGSVDENSGTDQIIYTAEANEEVSFGLVGSYQKLSINPTTGAVTLDDGSDFEQESEYFFTVIATDTSNNKSGALSVTVNVTDIDEVAPSITSAPTGNVIDENSGANLAVYVVTATDIADVSQGVTYSLTDENLGFSIDSISGIVTTNDDFAADFEAAQSQSFVVVATDVAGNASQQTVSVAVNNVDEAAPVFESPTTVSVLEGSDVNTQVYVALANDLADVSAGVTFSLSEDSDSALSIDSVTGQVTLADQPDYAVKPSYSFTVIADDGVNQSHIEVTLSVVDEDLEAPVFTSSPTPSIEENIGANQVVYTAVATDDFVVTYSLQVGHDSGLSIDASTGEVSLDVNPDFYTKNEYSFTVVATDTSDNSSELAVTLAVNSIDDDAPMITSSTTATSIEESSGAGQVIYTVTSDDAEASYSLGAGSDPALVIDAETGDVTLTTNPVYVTQSEYFFAVIATDAAGNASAPQSVTLTINEVAGGSTLPTTGNLVTDGTFDEATSTTWYGNAYNPVDDVNQANVEAAGDAWDVNLSGYVNLTAGEDYTLSFDVSGTDGRTMVAGIGQSVDPYLGHTDTVTLSATSRLVVFHLRAKAEGTGDDFGGATSRVIFDMGADTGAVSIDNVSLVAGHIGTPDNIVVDTGGNTPLTYGRQGPLDMTGAYGNGAVTGDEGEFFINDSTKGFDYSGFANLVTELYPFEFGTGGTLEFTASVPTGESVDVSFQLQKQGSDDGLLCEYGPVWDSGATTVSSANAQNFTIEIPAQGGDTFSNMIMELSADDINVKITDVYVTTSEKTDAEQTVPAQCDGSLDMTVAYGNGAVSGELGEFFMNDTSKGEEFSGFANGTTDVYPFEFGSGGTLEFTASVPEGQATTSVDVNFQFQKQGSDTGKFCDIAPIWEASNTVSGPVDETFTVAIPSQGGNTFSNLIMELSVDDVNVKITGVKVTPSAKTADAPTVPEICEAAPLPSIYPVDGINSAAMFNGTFGDEEGGLATIQSFDSYEFPTGSASYGGWSNGNQTLYPIEYTGGGFFAQKKIYFCASTTEAATVYFRFENEVYPANSTIYNTDEVSLITDGVMRAYALDAQVTYPVNSLLFLMLERDTAITMGKVMGNWNGLDTQNITTDTDDDGVVDYCEDFPNDTPEWVDTDGDGASDDADDFPEDASQWEAATP